MTEVNNVACYRLGNIFYPEITKGKEVMKTSEFQHNIGGNAAWKKRIMTSTKGGVKL